MYLTLSPSLNTHVCPHHAPWALHTVVQLRRLSPDQPSVWALSHLAWAPIAMPGCSSMWTPSPPYSVSNLESFWFPSLPLTPGVGLPTWQCPTYGFRTELSRKESQRKNREGKERVERVGKEKEESCAAPDTSWNGHLLWAFLSNHLANQPSLIWCSLCQDSWELRLEHKGKACSLPTRTSGQMRWKLII